MDIKLDNTSQSLVFWGKNQTPEYSIQHNDLPDNLLEGEVLVKVELATLCGSDLHTLKGTRSTATPCVLGHEGCGHVIKSARLEVPAGTRVTWGVCDSCDKCFYCKLNLQNKCIKVLKMGHTEMTQADLFGTYSSHVLIRAGVPVVALPGVLTPQLAAPINCALATMVNAMSQLPNTLDPGAPGARTALVQGAGLLGVYAVTLLREAGYTTVYCVDVNATRLAMVKDFGGIPVHSTQEDAVICACSVDVVMEVCGVKQVIPNGIRALRVGGTYLMMGLVHPDSDLDLKVETIIRKCLTIKGLHNYNGQHLQEAVTFLQKYHSKYPFLSLLGPVYPLTEFQAAVAAAETGEFHRVAINPHM